MASLLVLSVTSCTKEPGPAVSPIDARYYFSGTSGRDPRLMVLLPGRDDGPGAFDENGFIKILREHAPDFDVIAVDAHLGYYVENTLVRRLKEDIIDPARQNGYKSVWLAGVSMGSVGCIAYAAEHPRDVSGIVLIAPYLGDDKVIADIGRAGRPHRWPAKGESGNDWQRELWSSLKEMVMEPGQYPVIYLAYGTSDRYAGGAEILSRYLSGERVFTKGGGHRWTVWKRLWEDFVMKIPEREILR